MWECGWEGTEALWKCGSPPSDWSHCFYSLEKLRSELSKFPMSFHPEFSPADSIFSVIAHPSCFFFVELKRAAANSGEMHFLGAWLPPSGGAPCLLRVHNPFYVFQAGEGPGCTLVSYTRQTRLHFRAQCSVPLECRLSFLFVCFLLIKPIYLLIKFLKIFVIFFWGEAQWDLESLLVICMSSRWLVCSYACSGYYLICEDSSYIKCRNSVLFLTNYFSEFFVCILISLYYLFDAWMSCFYVAQFKNLFLCSFLCAFGFWKSFWSHSWVNSQCSSVCTHTCHLLLALGGWWLRFSEKKENDWAGAPPTPL